MKKIDVSALLGTLGAPFLKQTFVHTDEQVKEVVDALVKSLIGTYTTNDLIILHGCVITGTTTKAITAGAIYYNGEVYLVDAASGLTAGADTWIFAIVTTYAAGDPVTYDDSTTHNQHQIDKIAFQVGVGGAGIANWDGVTVKLKRQIKVIPIGDWDMYTNSSVTIAHGLSDRWRKITEITGFIRNDADTLSYKLAWRDSAGAISLNTNHNATDIFIFRDSTDFDTVDFNSTGYNRGYIFIEYGDI